MFVYSIALLVAHCFLLIRKMRQHPINPGIECGAIQTMRQVVTTKYPQGLRRIDPACLRHRQSQQFLHAVSRGAEYFLLRPLRHTQVAQGQIGALGDIVPFRFDQASVENRKNEQIDISFLLFVRLSQFNLRGRQGSLPRPVLFFEQRLPPRNSSSVSVPRGAAESARRFSTAPLDLNPRDPHLFRFPFRHKARRTRIHHTHRETRPEPAPDMGSQFPTGEKWSGTVDPLITITLPTVGSSLQCAKCATDSEGIRIEADALVVERKIFLHGLDRRCEMELVCASPLTAEPSHR